MKTQPGRANPGPHRAQRGAVMAQAIAFLLAWSAEQQRKAGK